MTPNDLTHILDENEIARLREGFDADALVRANVVALEGAYAPLKAWGEATGTVFYGNEPLSASEREICLVALLAVSAPEISLSYHIYWALMEGVSAAKICQTLGLAGCYAGMPVMVRGLTTASKTFASLKRIAAGPDRSSQRVFSTLMRELSGLPTAEAK